MSKLLDAIVAQKRLEVERAKKAIAPELIAETLEPSMRSFFASLSGGRENTRPHLIAEIKRKSPSKGEINTGFDLERTLQAYESCASAISVLTDYQYFGGSLEDLSEVDLRTRLPVLRKEFIIDEYQLLEARQFGADAVLLIAAILSPDELCYLLERTQALGMDALVEVHTAAELAQVLDTPAQIIGINNRNLDTLKIDLQTTHDLAAQIPREKVIVAESGIETREQIADLAGKVDAMLIGTSLLAAPDLPAKLAELGFERAE